MHNPLLAPAVRLSHNPAKRRKAHSDSGVRRPVLVAVPSATAGEVADADAVQSWSVVGYAHFARSDVFDPPSHTEMKMITSMKAHWLKSALMYKLPVAAVVHTSGWFSEAFEVQLPIRKHIQS